MLNNPPNLTVSSWMEDAICAKSHEYTNAIGLLNIISNCNEYEFLLSQTNHLKGNLVLKWYKIAYLSVTNEVKSYGPAQEILVFINSCAKASFKPPCWLTKSG